MILVINCGSNKTRFITQIVDDEIDVDEIGIFDLKASTLDKYTGIIISGAPILLTEQNIDPYLEVLNGILETKKPLLGICFGHQLIGLKYGSIASKMRTISDMEEISVLEDSPLFNRLPQEISMMEDHCETISIPKGFKLLASSDSCVNEAMEKRDAAIYGVQFHPEVSGNHGAIVIQNFISICLENEPKA
ncbi:MAG: glutamine amidotransferase-related protein [Crocinitomicaceae bacterium]